MFVFIDHVVFSIQSQLKFKTLKTKYCTCKVNDVDWTHFVRKRIVYLYLSVDEDWIELKSTKFLWFTANVCSVLQILFCCSVVGHLLFQRPNLISHNTIEILIEDIHFHPINKSGSFLVYFFFLFSHSED